MKAKSVTISLSTTLLDRIKQKAAKRSEEQERRVSVSEVISKVLVKHFPKSKGVKKNVKRS